jgi:antitoxin CptB
LRGNERNCVNAKETRSAQVDANDADICWLALYIHRARHVRAFGVGENFGKNFGKSLATAMTERSSEGLDVRRRRLLFRAWRRGVREMDLIVGRFADAHIGTLDEPSLDDFEALIEVPNAELYAWVTGEGEIPQSHDTAVLRQLIAFHQRDEAKR